MNRSPDDTAATDGVTRGGDDDSIVSLRIVHRELVATLPLPTQGSVVVGRGASADLRIDDRSISRRHAVIHAGSTLSIEDCGSANGTQVGGVRLEPGRRAELCPGMLVQLGSVRAFVQHGAVGRAGGPGDGAFRGAAVARDADSELARLRPLIGRVALGTIPVLVCGETGAGKEVVANAIHAASPRATKPLVRLNCAALSEHLLESELFGHEKGAFTGAHQAKPGLLETAAGGTLFLDEIGDLPLPMQPKLLRVVEDRAVMRVGGLSPRPVDVRFITATNHDLEADVEAGRFRRDLFFRLNGVLIYVRPLRERVGEITELARLFVREAARAARVDPPALSAEASRRLEAHVWPGNVRELKNVMERAVLLCSGGDAIGVDHLPIDRFLRAAVPVSPPLEPGAPPGRLRDELAGLERERLLDVLTRCAGNQTLAAKTLGISRGTLMSRLEAYGVPRPRKKRS